MAKPINVKELESLKVIAKGMSAIRVPPEHVLTLIRMELVEMKGGLRLTDAGRERVKLPL
jgi:hypothetical protein